MSKSLKNKIMKKVINHQGLAKIGDYGGLLLIYAIRNRNVSSVRLSTKGISFEIYEKVRSKLVLSSVSFNLLQNQIKRKLGQFNEK